MESLAELLSAVLELLLRVTFFAAGAILAPLRFLVSSRYRNGKRKQWADSPVRHVLDLWAGLFSVLFFAAVALLWVKVFQPAAKTPGIPSVEANGITLKVDTVKEKTKSSLRNLVDAFTDREVREPGND